MSYRVKTGLFEGPLALLVYLIEHAQMSIYDIRDIRDNRSVHSVRGGHEER